MAVSKHTRKGKVRRHKNSTFGVHVNGRKIGIKSNNRYLKLGKGVNR